MATNPAADSVWREYSHRCLAFSFLSIVNSYRGLNPQMTTVTALPFEITERNSDGNRRVIGRSTAGGTT
jgi:hypothetical protein